MAEIPGWWTEAELGLLIGVREGRISQAEADRIAKQMDEAWILWRLAEKKLDGDDNQIEELLFSVRRNGPSEWSPTG